MHFRLVSGQFSATVSNHGAEVVSLMDNHLNREYIWQGDPAYWEGQAPFLFPLVGRMPEGKLRIRGEEYPMPLHGFARDFDYQVTEADDSHIVMTLCDNAETRKMYPFAFRLICAFTLTDNVLTVQRTVENRTKEPMPFCIGEHFGFNIPFDGRNITDYYLRLLQKETVPIYRVTENFDLSEPEPFFENGDTIPLDPHTFDHDALIFCDLKKNGAAIENNLDSHGAAVFAPDFGQLAFWAMPNAPFVCIEPWCGHISPPNTPIDLEQRANVLTLPPESNKTFTTTVTIY